MRRAHAAKTLKSISDARLVLRPGQRERTGPEDRQQRAGDGPRRGARRRGGVWRGTGSPSAPTRWWSAQRRRAVVGGVVATGADAVGSGVGAGESLGVDVGDADGGSDGDVVGAGAGAVAAGQVVGAGCVVAGSVRAPGSSVAGGAVVAPGAATAGTIRSAP